MATAKKPAPKARGTAKGAQKPTQPPPNAPQPSPAPADPDVLAVAQGAPAAPDDPQPQQPPSPTESAQVTALVIVEIAEQLVAARWPAARYDEATRQRARERLAPVLLKYNAGVPPWLKRWKEELELSAFVALTAFQTWQLIEADKAAKADSNDGETPKPDAAQP